MLEQYSLNSLTNFPVHFIYISFQFKPWNINKDGHGKGAQDGVGAALRRTADQIVAHGTNTPKRTTMT